MLYAIARNSRRITRARSVRSGVHVGVLDSSTKVDFMAGLLKFLGILLTSGAIPVSRSKAPYGRTAHASSYSSTLAMPSWHPAHQ